MNISDFLRQERENGNHQNAAKSLDKFRDFSLKGQHVHLEEATSVRGFRGRRGVSYPIHGGPEEGDIEISAYVPKGEVEISNPYHWEWRAVPAAKHPLFV